ELGTQSTRFSNFGRYISRLRTTLIKQSSTESFSQSTSFRYTLSRNTGSFTTFVKETLSTKSWSKPSLVCNTSSRDACFLTALIKQRTTELGTQSACLNHTRCYSTGSFTRLIK
ncbi:unnamed protein product, partial [marine sediment metagenome]